MSRLVLIHGAFNELWGPNELKARWLPAVQDGLWRNDATIDPDDVSVCFYGDLFRLDRSTLDEDQWKQSRAGAEDMLASFGGNDALGMLSQAAGKAAYDRTIDMVAFMASDPSLTERVQQRLLDAVTDDTRVVVGHSLGSVISYETLSQRPELPVHTLITLGSPLGSGYFVHGDPPGPWPGSVQRWVNVCAHGDHIAYPSKVGAYFGDRVEEVVIDNGHRGHDPEPYLNARLTGAAIAEALAD
ncbi:MAG: hypothetical protein OES57_16065 [Acidimicrobiia bacterium]|nr:hypothetical protein [Acidimicrobiia bacterium]